MQFQVTIKGLFAFSLHGPVNFILLETISINELRSRWTSAVEQSVIFMMLEKN